MSRINKDKATERREAPEPAIGPRAVDRIIEELQAIARHGTRGNWHAMIRSTNGIITVHEVMPPRTSHIVNTTRH